MTMLETTEKWLETADWLTDSNKPGVELLKLLAIDVDNLTKPNGALMGYYRLVYNDLMKNKPEDVSSEDEGDDLIGVEE